MLAVSYPNSSSSFLTNPGAMDESETINPAALNASSSTIAPNLLSHPSQRGVKRSRSPDSYGVHGQEAESDENQGIKRNKSLKQVDSPTNSAQQMAFATPHQPVQTPQIRTSSLPQTSPSQTSPARSTPGSATKSGVVKALPTVRDHTTDQLGEDGDEYVPREKDEAGEKKVSKDGYPQDGRNYRCRTFQVPNRGEKLFMLATECARVLGYRDSYLLFNKNRSLYKIIANQAEKDNLIHQEILPYSYRSRQIAIVTARSMFRQFGARLIENGRKVRDDYWEGKARKQGFTEEDLASEKRPGAAKQREAQQAAESSHSSLTSLPQSEIIYSNGPGFDGQPPGIGQVSLAPLPMIHLPSEELRPGVYGNIIRPRQEIAGPPYQDRIQASGGAEILNQAAQAAEYNKQLSQTRSHRANYLNDYWKRPHEQPTAQTQAEGDMNAVATQHMQSPQAVAGMSQGRTQQDQLSRANSQMMAPGFPGYPNQQNPMASPVQAMHRQMPSSQMHPNTPMAGQRQNAYAGYPPNQMWQAPQPQPSPLSQAHHVSQYSQQHHQSPMPPPQMPQQTSMAYQQQMAQMGNPSFAGMSRGMYQTNPNAQQFNMQSAAGQQPGMQGWSTPGNTGMQDWQRYQ